MPFDNTAKEAMLDEFASMVDKVSIHTGDPGSGASNEVTGGGYARLDASFDPASGNSIALADTLEFDGPASADALWFCVWAAGPTRLGKGQITGDTAFNTDGVFHLTTGTTATIDNPA